jgi:hypothetical protein
VAALTTAPAAATRTLAALLAVVLIAGCSKEERAQVPTACFAEPRTMLAALERAPGAVALQDGTVLSRCVSAAHTDGDLQALGLTLIGAADALRADAGADPGAALRLGYLAGAVHAGAAKSSGAIAAQLARRVEQAATLAADAGPASVSALAHGRRAGERAG